MIGFVIFLISTAGAFIWPAVVRDTINWFSPLAGYAVTMTYMQAFFLIQIKSVLLFRHTKADALAEEEFKKKTDIERIGFQIGYSIILPLLVWLVNFIIYKVAA